MHINFQVQVFHFRVVKALIEAGADPNCADKFSTVAEIARDKHLNPLNGESLCKYMFFSMLMNFCTLSHRDGCLEISVTDLMLNETNDDILLPARPKLTIY